MIRLPTVVLEHRLPGQPHHDWLLADPADPVGPLWAARIDRPPAQWLDAATLPLIPLPPHRRRYLTYEGPVSGNRGTVRRVATGWHAPRLWTPARIITTVTLTDAPPFDAELTRLPGGDRWQASFGERTGECR